MFMKVKEWINNNGEKFIHSDYFIALVAAVAFIGWWSDLLPLSYYGMAILMLVALLFTMDMNVFLIFIPFAMTCFRHFFFFDSIPAEIFVIVIALFVSLFGIVIKRLLYNKRNNIKFQFKFGLIGKSMTVITVVCFLATIVRHIFYNEPAFPDYAYGYNIGLGYLASTVILLMLIVTLLFSNFGENYGFDFFAKIFYAFAIYLVGQHIIACLELYGLNIKEYHNVYWDGQIGWTHKNTMAIAVEITLPFMAYLYSKNFKRVDILVVTGILGLFTLAGDSRGGQLTVASMVLLLAYILVRNTKKVWRNYFILVGSLVVGATGIILIVPSIRESIVRIFELGFETYGRTEFWGWIMTYVFHQPEHLMLGGSPAYLFELYPAFWEGTKPELGIWLCHNTFVTVIAGAGLIGLIAIIYHFVEATGSIFKRCGTEKIIIFTFFFAGFIHGLIDNTFFNPLFMLPYIVIMSAYDKPIKDLF